MRNVWPKDMVADRLARDLARLHPLVLLLYHPTKRIWQAYQLRDRAWDARRLYEAIIRERAVRAKAEAGTDTMLEWPEVRWWDAKDARGHPAAPRIFDEDFPLAPGPWLLKWLEECTCPSREFVEGLDAEYARRRESRAREVSNVHEGVVDDTWRYARDEIPTGASVTDALKELRRAEGRPEVVY